MKRYILTGTPGAGKTALLRLFVQHGYAVIKEAATDVIALAIARGIAEPWANSWFIDDVVALQRQRQLRTQGATDKVVIFDRSPICTWALCQYLGLTPSENLRREVERIDAEGIYERQVFFIDNLGHCEPTEARRISFEECLRFERIHAAAYRQFGYECAHIPQAGLEARFDRVRRMIVIDS